MQIYKPTCSLLALSLFATVALCETSQMSKSQGIEIVDGWEFSGDIRVGWVDFDYDNPPTGISANGKVETKYWPNSSLINQGHIDSKGIYIIPKLSISSPKSNKIRAKITVAGATDLGLNDEKYASRTFVYDSSGRKSFAILQEAYISYEDKANRLLVGREEISTPMIDKDDWYMLANSFELAYYQNNSFKDITLLAGYFLSMSGVWDSGANGTEFHSMSQASFIDAADKAIIGEKGIYFASFTYNDRKHHNLQLWNYYARDMYNTLFMQYDYRDVVGFLEYDFGLQFINFKEVGYLASDAANTNIDFSLYSARFDGKFSNGVDFATGAANYTSGEGQSATIGAYGGYPYFANGMIFHAFEPGSLQNASSYKAQIGYDFAKLGIPTLWAGYRYTYFNLDPDYSKNLSGESQSAMSLNGLKVSYGEAVGAYFTGTYEHVNLDNEPSTFCLRLIGGYKF